MLSLDESNRDEYEQRLKWYMDELNLLRARDTAEEKGFQKGCERGMEQKTRETAWKMKMKDFSAADITEYTGLSEEEINKI